MKLDWAFSKSLQSRQQQLIEQLKPNVIEWSQEMFEKLHVRLNLASSMTQLVMCTREVKLKGVYMFNAILHNRDIGIDVIAMVSDREDMFDIKDTKLYTLLDECWNDCLNSTQWNPER